MPHSTTTSDPDTMATESATGDAEHQTPETTPPANTITESQDADMTMVDVGAEGDDVLPDAVSVKKENKAELKLEDLFADMDSDEEFPSSHVAADNNQSSSPEASASPMYVSTYLIKSRQC